MNQVTMKTLNNQAQRLADFDSLTEALDYAAKGVTGCSFFDTRGKLTTSLSYQDLRRRALTSARRLKQLGLQRGDRVALVADTEAEFIVLFFACLYAGLVPFAMPVPVNIGSHKIYVRQLRGVLKEGSAAVAIAPEDYLALLKEAADGLQQLRWIGTARQLETVPEASITLQASRADEPAYIQFTSGSTRFPQGVIITGEAIMSNLQGIVRSGLKVQAGDRCASWLPFYHDMGLVGFVLGPIATQLSVDYIKTRDFAIRPVQWLRLISRNKCTIAFSPPFGFDLCARRVRSSDLKDLDLGHWRVAGVGAEMIRPRILENFAKTLSPTGFSSRAFLPCYGLAEAALAASFPALDHGLDIMYVDARSMEESGVVMPLQMSKEQTRERKVNEIVNCGRALPGHSISIVDNKGKLQADLRVGRVMIAGPSLMSGYINDSAATNEVFTDDGWLDSGDLGYIFEDNLYLTGRHKDLIIINGRNIRAIDLEELAEEQDEVRIGDTSAFAVAASDEDQNVVLVVECRISDIANRLSLVARLKRLIYEGFGIHCIVEVVPPHTLPRTSSGKLSRVAAREGFIERANWNKSMTTEAETG